jgi:hypothetical protein
VNDCSRTDTFRPDRSETVGLVIPQRFCGPPVSGNGGFSAGALAQHLPGGATGTDGWPEIEVTLHLPPPLDTPMPVRIDEGGATAEHDGRVVAVARLSRSPLTPAASVDADLARSAQARFPGLLQHPFGTCFACGPQRAPGDGLRIFPGEVDTGLVAATWTPHPSLAADADPYLEGAHRTSLPVTWAALDCVGGWSEDLLGRPMVLGRMTARVDALPVIGEEHVVVGEHRGSQGRKTFSAATLYDSDGRVVATAEHTWISVDPEDFR